MVLTNQCKSHAEHASRVLRCEELWSTECISGIAQLPASAGADYPECSSGRRGPKELSSQAAASSAFLLQQPNPLGISQVVARMQVSNWGRQMSCQQPADHALHANVMQMCCCLGIMPCGRRRNRALPRPYMGAKEEQKDVKMAIYILIRTQQHQGRQH